MTATLHGRNGPFSWLCCRDERLSLGWLCERMPRLVLDRYVAVTSFDSGPLRPTADSISGGWVYNRDVAYSPKITDVDELPLAGWDEWYVFTSPCRLPPADVFVNYSDFTVAMMDIDGASEDADSEEVRLHTQGRTERFWAQLRIIDPFGFLADGTALTCVLRDEILFREVLEVVENAAS